MVVTFSAMNRREPLKPVAVMNRNGRPQSKLFGLNPSAKHIVFFDPKLSPPDFVETHLANYPECIVCSVDVPIGKTLDDTIRIFDGA